MLSVTLVVFTAGAVVYGRLDTRPGQFEMLGFALCDNVPCIKGIKPGMSSRDAERLLGEQPGGPPGNRWIYAALGNREMVIRATRDNYRVKQIHASTMILPTIADFVQLYGAPCAVAKFGTAGAALDLLYPYMKIRVMLDDDHISLKSRVHDVNLLDNSVVDQYNDCVHIDSSYKAPWLGLTSYSRYVTYYAIR